MIWMGACADSALVIVVAHADDSKKEQKCSR